MGIKVWSVKPKGDNIMNLSYLVVAKDADAAKLKFIAEHEEYTIDDIASVKDSTPKGMQHSMHEPNKVNKALEIAKTIDKDVQKIVEKLFEKCEATPKLLKDNPDVYYVHSNQIFSAIIACAAQRMLKDGLNRQRVGGKTYEGARLAWILFLENNPEIAEKVAKEKAAKEAKWAKQEEEPDEPDEDEDDEGEEDEANDNED